MKWFVGIIIYCSLSLIVNNSSANELQLGPMSLANSVSVTIKTQPRLLVTTTGIGVDISLELANTSVFGADAGLNAYRNNEIKQQLAAGAELFKFNPEATCEFLTAQVNSYSLESSSAECTATQDCSLDVSWAFSCSHPKALRHMHTQLFTQFPQAFEPLLVEWATEANEGSFVTSEDTVIEFY